MSNVQVSTNITLQKIEQTVGGYMLAHSTAKGVDLHNPEVTIRLELINNQLNIITLKHIGLAGFPLGTQGRHTLFNVRWF